MEQADFEEMVRAQEEARKKSENLVEGNMKMVGDRYTIAQAVMLLSYIRHAIRTGKKTVIKVTVGNRKSDPSSFNFILNNDEVDDLIPVENFEIN